MKALLQDLQVDIFQLEYWPWTAFDWFHGADSVQANDQPLCLASPCVFQGTQLGTRSILDPNDTHAAACLPLSIRPEKKPPF